MVFFCPVVTVKSLFLPLTSILCWVKPIGTTVKLFRTLWQIAVLEEQKKEAEENTDDDEAKLAESDDNAEEEASKSDGNGEKPDINDVPMEENQVINSIHFFTLVIIYISWKLILCMCIPNEVNCKQIWSTFLSLQSQTLTLLFNHSILIEASKEYSVRYTDNSVRQFKQQQKLKMVCFNEKESMG